MCNPHIASSLPTSLTYISDFVCGHTLFVGILHLWGHFICGDTSFVGTLLLLSFGLNLTAPGEGNLIDSLFHFLGNGGSQWRSSDTSGHLLGITS